MTAPPGSKEPGVSFFCPDLRNPPEAFILYPVEVYPLKEREGKA